MAIAYVAQPGNFYSATSAVNTVVPILSNVPVGSFLVAAFRLGNGNLVTGVTDTQGNTWTQTVKSNAAGTTNSFTYTCMVTTALSTTDTVTAAHVAVANRAGLILQFNGVQSASADKTNSNITTVASTTLGTNTTASLNNSSELSIITLATNVVVTAQAATGYTVFGNNTGAIGYKILSNDSTGQTGTWTWTTSSGNTAATISTYLPKVTGLTLGGVG